MEEVEGEQGHAPRQAGVGVPQHAVHVTSGCQVHSYSATTGRPSSTTDQPTHLRLSWRESELERLPEPSMLQAGQGSREA